MMTKRISRICQSIAPSATLKINAQVSEMRARGQDVISLGAGEPDFDTPAHICAAAIRAIHAGQTRYTAVSGAIELRKAVADSLQKEKGLSYAPDQIVVTTGAKQALMNALAAVLNPGDEVLLPAPCWISYPEMIAMAGGKAVWVHGEEKEGFIPSLEKLRAALTPRTRALIINSPSNPTGAVWSREQIEAVGEMAEEKGLIIISDEIYDHIAYGGIVPCSPAALSPALYERTIVINGWSKTYAMTGWRLGYAAAPKDIAAAMAAYQSHATGNPNSIAQAAGLAALEGDQSCVEEMAAAFARRRDLMAGLIQRAPHVSCFLPQGAFYMMLNIRPLLGRSVAGRRIQSSGDFAEMLLHCAQVAVVDGAPFGAEGYCRLSFAAADEKIREAMDRLSRFLESIDP